MNDEAVELYKVSCAVAIAALYGGRQASTHCVEWVKLFSFPEGDIESEALHWAYSRAPEPDSHDDGKRASLLQCRWRFMQKGDGMLERGCHALAIVTFHDGCCSFAGKRRTDKKTPDWQPIGLLNLQQLRDCFFILLYYNGGDHVQTPSDLTVTRLEFDALI